MKFTRYRLSIGKATKYMKSRKQKRERTKQKELLNSEFDLLVGPLHAFVCFKDAEYFGCKAFKRGFRHCFIILKTEHGWINLNPSRNLLIATIADCYLYDPYIEVLKKNEPDMTIIEIVINNNFRKMVTLNLLTCVTLVKYALGLKFRAFSAVTPYQLYKKLISGSHPNIVKVREIPKWNQSPLRKVARPLSQPQQKPELKQQG